jgi:hypothetical protein
VRIGAERRSRTGQPRTADRAYEPGVDNHVKPPYRSTEFPGSNDLPASSSACSSTSFVSPGGTVPCWSKTRAGRKGASCRDDPLQCVRTRDPRDCATPWWRRTSQDSELMRLLRHHSSLDPSAKVIGGQALRRGDQEPGRLSGLGWDFAAKRTDLNGCGCCPAVWPLPPEYVSAF